jgi:hypothetical protein
VWLQSTVTISWAATSNSPLARDATNLLAVADEVIE